MALFVCGRYDSVIGSNALFIRKRYAWTLEQFLPNTVPLNNCEFVCQIKHCLTGTEFDTALFLFKVLLTKEKHLGLSNSFSLSHADLDVIISFLVT